jgi:hypothetical protein
MKWQTLSIAGLAFAFLSSLGLPSARGADRDDHARFKKDVLQAVERLMDKKLKAFKADLLKDIRRMLRDGAERREPARVQDREVRVLRGGKPQAEKQARRVMVKRVQADRDGHAEREGHGGCEGCGRCGNREVQVVHKDGKVVVRLEVDGKVIEKAFEIGDPAMKKWMSRNMPKGFHVEVPEGRARVYVQGKKVQGGDREGASDRSRERRNVRVLRLGEPDGMRPGGKAFEAWLKSLAERFGEQWKRARKDGGARRFELDRDFEFPFVQERKEARDRRSAEGRRGGRRDAASELERLQREKEALRRELAELRQMLEKALGRRKRR